VLRERERGERERGERERRERERLFLSHYRIEPFSKVICTSIKHLPTQKLIKSGVSDMKFTASG
jgi:hypothetical protein